MSFQSTFLPITARPFTLLGGYLGAGKTTFLNQLLQTESHIRFGVLVNDFGDINLDAKLIANADGATIALENGCVCCQVGDDFSGAVAAVLETGVDQVVMEASGVALPNRIAARAAACPGLAPALRIVLVDALNIRSRMQDKFVGKHVAVGLQQADLLVITKTEQITQPQLQSLQRWLSTTTAVRQVVAARQTPASVLVTQATFSVHSDKAALEQPTKFQSRSFCSPLPVCEATLRAWLSELPVDIYRLKGLVVLNDGRRLLIQKVASQLELTAALNRGKVLRASQASELVVISAPGSASLASLSDPFARSDTGG